MQASKHLVRPIYVKDSPLYVSTMCTQVKDASLVFDGNTWHIYGTSHFLNNDKDDIGPVLHATAPDIFGPWTEQPHIILDVKGGSVAAPGVIYDEGIFHMFIHTDVFDVGGSIVHLTSENGFDFTYCDKVLDSQEGDETGIYDAHPVKIGGKKYLLYTGMPILGHGDIFLARMDEWGVAERAGKILSHTQVEHHNQHDQPDYEWGLEGAQLTELPSGRILMNAVCFLPSGQRDTRQRLFFAVAEKVEGPYISLGPVIDPGKSWDSGENGHGSAEIFDGKLHVIYQARPPFGCWQFGHAIFNIDDIERAADEALRNFFMQAQQPIMDEQRKA